MHIRRTYLRMLAEDVAPNLTRFDQRTGRFLTQGGWAVTNQDIVYPLALLYLTEDSVNPYYRDERILEYAVRGADAWRDFQYPDGTVEFVKVDGSKWGPTYMPWSMYHWLETYALLRDLLDTKRKARWEEGLTLAYQGIAESLKTASVHNIPTWHGMALYRAGQLFERPDWQEAGHRMIQRAVDGQTSQGYWPEHEGPTTSYNLVYVHAIGLYHEFSGDDSVLPCLERATEFHIRYTYPDGRLIETIDGRVKFHDRVPDSAHAAFSLFPQGRRYVRLLVENMLKRRQEHQGPHLSYVVSSGSIKVAGAEFGLSPRLASAYVHYHDGPEAAIPQDNMQYHIHDKGHAIIRRDKAWLYCLSGIVTTPTENRWGQDRQDFVSVWNERTGLIVGGGNSKNQPEWSTFVVGEGDSAVYLPSTASLSPGDGSDVVSLVYDQQQCTVEATVAGPESLVLRLRSASDRPTRGQLLFKLHTGEALTTGTGSTFTVGAEPLSLTAEEAKGSIFHHGWRLFLPPGSMFSWPVSPFNPYTKDGSAPLEQAVATLGVPLGEQPVEVVIEECAE